MTDIINELTKKEIWKNVVVAGKTYEGYSISTHGNLISHLRKNKYGKTSIDPSFRRSIKFSPALNKNGKIRAMYKKLTLPNGFFEGTYLENENYYNPNDNVFTYRRHAHQLVMETFLPIFQYPPKRLELYWKQLPYEVQHWIYECIVIDHIDNDPSNNRLDNLRYGTAGENSRWAKEHYGGNFANKTLTKDVKSNSILAFV